VCLREEESYTGLSKSLSYTRECLLLCVMVVWQSDDSHYAWRACALVNGIISHMRALWRRRDIPPRAGWVKRTAEYIQEKGENFTWYKHNIKVPSRKFIIHTYTFIYYIIIYMLNLYAKFYFASFFYCIIYFII